MKYGFSFNRIHSDNIDGLTVKTVSRPLTPEMRDNKFIVPHADGAMFGAMANPFKRAFYETRVFAIYMTVTASGITALTKKLAKISEWLTGRGILIFDDTPLIEWDAAGVGIIDYAPERSGTKAILSASFEVQPFGHLPWTANEGVMLGQNRIYLGDNISIGPDIYLNAVMSGNNVEFTVLNYGSCYTRPKITIKTTGTEKRIGKVSVTANGDTKMKLYTAGSSMIADCERHILTDNNGNNIMAGDTASVGFSGEFIELRRGENILTFEKEASATAGNLEITVDYTPRVMWNFDFDDVDWGTVNA